MKQLKYTLYYSYMNDKEMLINSINSIKNTFSNIVVLNNSEEKLNIEGVEEIEAQVPLSFSQAMNFFQKTSEKRGDDYYLWAHTDMLAPEGIPEQIKKYVEENFDKNWGVIFTLYDILGIYNTQNLKKVGGFDWKMFPNYFADNDFYLRVKLAGLEILESGIKVIHNNGGSATIKRKDLWAHQHNINFPLHEKAYIAKWGNKTGQEIYKKPYNLDL